MTLQGSFTRTVNVHNADLFIDKSVFRNTRKSFVNWEAIFGDNWWLFSHHMVYLVTFCLKLLGGWGRGQRSSKHPKKYFMNILRCFDDHQM